MTRRGSHDGGRNVHSPLPLSYDVPDADRPCRHVVSPGVTSSTIPANRRNRVDATVPVTCRVGCRST